MASYYNENDEFAAQWLRQLIAGGMIADGDVDTRSIVDVSPSDLAGYSQHHFFAGIGGWSYALRLAGWPYDRPVWTGSCPCQPFSLAGKRRGFGDERHLWPVWRNLISECEPSIIFGEQVASASEWLRLVRSDLEAMDYAVGAIPIQAASAGADHFRDRYWFVAHDQSEQVGSAGRSWECRDVEHDPRQRRGEGQPEHEVRRGRTAATESGILVDAARQRIDGRESASIQTRSARTQDADIEWVTGADGKARRVKSGVRLLADGFPNRVGLLRGFGNAIDPRPAAAFIKAYMSI
jgi:DNA (cytosine-5)-methyltransferase 1